MPPMNARSRRWQAKNARSKLSKLVQLDRTTQPCVNIVIDSSSEAVRGCIVSLCGIREVFVGPMNLGTPEQLMSTSQSDAS